MVELQPGRILLEKYRIVRILGRGAMGFVAQAEHLHLEQPVALKFMLAEAAAVPGATERFLREARAAARLHSRHIVAVHDVDRLPDGTPYIAMEMLEGQDMAELLRARGPLPVEEALDIAAQLCHGLVEAHRHGIVHRDVKPANVFATTDDGGGRVVKILDFGISKLGTSHGLTQSGACIGSPLYMSPEQVRSSRDAGPRSDLWAVGIVLYELLTGRTPFAGEGFADVCLKILTEEASSPRASRPEIPAEVERVILRCLEKDPARRPAGAGELAEVLARLRALPPARDQATVDRSVGEIVRRRGGRGLGGALVAGAALAAVLALTRLAGAPAAPPAPREQVSEVARPPPEPVVQVTVTVDAGVASPADAAVDAQRPTAPAAQAEAPGKEKKDEWDKDRRK